MLVYRYEHPGDGRGPYTSMKAGGLKHAISAAHNDRQYTTHPGPWRDCGKPCNWDSNICGMVSPERLRKWFWGFNAKIKARGFVQKVYGVPKGAYRVSPRTGQVVFDREKAVVVPSPKTTRRGSRRADPECTTVTT